MNKQKVILFFITLILTCNLVGCNENEEVKESVISDVSTSDANSDNQTDFSNEIQNSSIENFNINAKVVVPDELKINDKIATLNVSLKQWDDERINKLLSYEPIIDTSTFENKSPEDIGKSYEFKNNSKATYYQGTILFDTPTRLEYQYYYLFDNWKNYFFTDELKNSFPNSELESVDKNNALNLANELINNVGIDVISPNPDIYALDKESVNKIHSENKLVDKNGNGLPEWTKDQEAYLFVYNVEYNNIPISALILYGDTIIYDCSKVNVIVGKDGIIGMTAYNIFEEDANTIEYKNICTPEEAADVVLNNYKDVIITEPVNISLIRLYYILEPVNDSLYNFKLKPVWLFYGETTVSKGDENYNSSTVYAVDAVSKDLLNINDIGG